MRPIIAAALLAALASSAVAQSSAPAANSNASNPAVATPNKNNAGAPAAGANSFTEGQAKSRIESAGYTNVSGLTKDKDGVWRGKGTKGGTPHDVSLDFQGNVVPK